MLIFFVVYSPRSNKIHEKQTREIHTETTEQNRTEIKKRKCYQYFIDLPTLTINI